MQRKLISLILFCLLIVFTANQVEAEPSYKQGFYTPQRGGIPAHPERWRNVVAAYACPLGVTGGTLFDQSGFKNQGILTSMDLATDWVVGRNGWELDFNGTAADPEQVLIAKNSIFEPSSQLSIFIAFDLDTFKGKLIAKSVNARGAPWASYELDADGASGDFRFALNTGGVLTTLNSTDSFSIGRHTIAGTYDGTTMRIYVDGRLQGSTAKTGTITYYASDLGIGGPTWSLPQDGDFADGKASVAYVFNCSLTSNEVLNLHINPLAMFKLRPLVFKAPTAPAAATLIQQIIMY